MKAGIGLLLISGVAAAAPGPITLKVKDAPLHEIARKLAEQSGCRIMGFAAQAKASVDVTNATLWEVLAKLETTDGIYTQFRGSQIVLDTQQAQSRVSWALSPAPTWTRHWRAGASGWAVALLGDTTGTRARLAVLGLSSGTIDKVTIAAAISNGKPLKATAGVPVALTACDPAVVSIELGGAPTKLTLRGQLAIKLPTVVERRIAVPLDDSVVDIAEARLRVHIASSLEAGNRSIHVGWDALGARVKIEAQLVDDQDQVVNAHGRGSSSMGTMGSESFTVPGTATKLFVLLKMPGSGTVEEKVTFRFDNEPLDKPTRPTP